MTAGADPSAAPTPQAPPSSNRDEVPDGAARRRRALLAGPGDMVRSMAVIVGIAALLVFLVPRPNRVSERPIDLGSAVSTAQAQLGFRPAAPGDLPDRWLLRAAEVRRDVEGIPTWHLVYVTPSGRYAGLDQAKGPTPEWVDRKVGDAPETGRRRIGGVDWVDRSRPDESAAGYVLTRGGVTTVLSGTATPPELELLGAAAVP